ncbi:aminomethyl-transferring glycine dehydrogenase subunit GcvPB [Microvirga sp. W0021]|uniref:glycine dehydrogenase (aminomethyl-transferring) n=1 Tax=Hohaiivirga grylli TaxID=3133970 RepID=A0ABV0BI88_9HYPH
MNNQGRPTHSGEVGQGNLHPTFTGNKALLQIEPLLFEVGRNDVTGVDIEDVAIDSNCLGNMGRQAQVELPALTEPEAMRHYVRLSQWNFGIDTGLFPLGSCTMKHNARLNEAMARLPGFGDIHPFQPLSTVQGALELMRELGRYLMTLTGMEAVALSPKAGAHGELCGMAAIKAAVDAKGEGATRTVVLVPESAHGTNPATAVMLGFSVKSFPTREDGKVDVADVKALLGPDVAAIMLTNPNTCGLFESQMKEIADAVHEAGGYFYCDGANFNAIVGKARPGDLGADAMHINLHKTFSTPHGGGGPGGGPVVFSKLLAPFVPVPQVRVDGDDLTLEEHADDKNFGRLTAFHGQMGVYVRSLSYMLSHGSDGMMQASEDAVLSANYIKACLSDLMSLPYGEQPCMHEVLFDDSWLSDTGVTTLDFAKAMIDEGYHPMTMYFPLVVHGAMLIEPTESESKASLDLFIAALRDLAMAAKNGDKERFTGAPYHAPRRRLDETSAARNPVLKWTESTKPNHHW